MSDHESSGHDRFETALRQLTPSPPSIDRDRLLFRAGQASGRRALGRLSLLTALVSAGIGVAGTYLGLGLTAPGPLTPQVVVVHVPVPTPAPPPPVFAEKKPDASTPAVVLSSEPSSSPSGWDAFGFSTSSTGYLQQRNQALRWGVEALPTSMPTSAEASPSSSAQPMNVLKMQADLLD